MREFVCFGRQMSLAGDLRAACGCCTIDLFANRQTGLVTVWDMITASRARMIPAVFFVNALRSQDGFGMFEC